MDSLLRKTMTWFFFFLEWLDWPIFWWCLLFFTRILYIFWLRVWRNIHANVRWNILWMLIENYRQETSLQSADEIIGYYSHFVTNYEIKIETRLKSKVFSLEILILLIWTNNVPTTNVAWTNVLVTVVICCICSQDPLFKVWSKSGQ